MARRLTTNQEIAGSIPASINKHEHLHRCSAFSFSILETRETGCRNSGKYLNIFCSPPQQSIIAARMAPRPVSSRTFVRSSTQVVYERTSSISNDMLPNVRHSVLASVATISILSCLSQSYVNPSILTHSSRRRTPESMVGRFESTANTIILRNYSLLNVSLGLTRSRVDGYVIRTNKSSRCCFHYWFGKVMPKNSCYDVKVVTPTRNPNQSTITFTPAWDMRLSVWARGKGTFICRHVYVWSDKTLMSRSRIEKARYLAWACV
jgi:hypothetical protein